MTQHLVVSIHDVCPAYEDAFHRWRRILDDWGVRKRSVGVVPWYEGGARTAESESLVAALKEEAAAGSEIVLHGWAHRFEGRYTTPGARLRDALTTRGCAEFSCLDAGGAEELLRKGTDELGPLIDGGIRGFTAPGWWQSSAVGPVLKAHGFRFYTLTFGVFDLVRDRFLHSPVVVGLPRIGRLSSAILDTYDFGLVHRAMRRRGLLRVAVHPYDLENKGFMRKLEALVRSELKYRSAATYEEVIQ